MKKRISKIITTLSVSALLFGSTGAYANPGAKDDSGGHICNTDCAKWGLKDGEYHIHPKVKFNGKTMNFEDVEPVILNGSTLVPLRAIFETLGASVEWVESTQTINAQKGSNRVVLQIGNQTAMVDGVQKPLNVSPQMIGDRTMVPLRFVSEAFGADVTFNNATNVVEINQDMQNPAPTPVPAQPTPPPAPTPSTPTPNSMSPMEYAAYLTNNFGEVKTSIGSYHVNLDYGTNSEGKLFIIGNFDNNEHLSYLENYFTIEPDLKAWSNAVGADFNKNFPGAVGGVAVYYVDYYSYYPTAYDYDEIKYVSGGQWRVNHRLFGVFILSSGNVVKVSP